jgi:hypothetical protein
MFLRASAHISRGEARALNDSKYGLRHAFVPRNLATDVPYAARMSGRRVSRSSGATLAVR